MAATPLAPTAPAAWQLELDLFRGPLHALLDLIERRELPVTRVSLVEVSDQFLALVRRSPTLDLDLTAEFLHVAARLLLLKSLALLPHAAAADPSEEPDDADGMDLEARLLIYRRFRDAARLLAARQEAGVRMIGAAAAAETLPPSSPPVEVDPLRLRRAARRALARVAERERTRAAAPRPLVAFTEVLQAVVERLRARPRLRFHDLAADSDDVIVAVTMFLAVLELVRRRRLTMLQHETFGPIELTLTVDGHAGDRDH